MFLGSFLLGQVITFGVAWTPDVGQPGITASTLTLRHDDGTTLGPLAGLGAANAWAVTAEPTKRGRWRVSWETTPEGGITSDDIYVS